MPISARNNSRYRYGLKELPVVLIDPELVGNIMLSLGGTNGEAIQIGTGTSNLGSLHEYPD